MALILWLKIVCKLRFFIVLTKSIPMFWFSITPKCTTEVQRKFFKVENVFATLKSTKMSRFKIYKMN